MAFKEYLSVRDLREKLELYDGEMEVVIIDDNKEEKEISDIDISLRKGEPKLGIRID